MKNYELVMIFSPESSEEEVNQTMERVTQTVAEEGGVLNEKEGWGVRKLAHRAKGVKEGNILSAHVSMEPRTVNKMEKSMTGAPGLVRHLLLKKN